MMILTRCVIRPRVGSVYCVLVEVGAFFGLGRLVVVVGKW